jgi:hypothetical protein
MLNYNITKEHVSISPVVAAQYCWHPAINCGPR